MVFLLGLAGGHAPFEVYESHGSTCRLIDLAISGTPPPIVGELVQPEIAPANSSTDHVSRVLSALDLMRDSTAFDAHLRAVESEVYSCSRILAMADIPDCGIMDFRDPHLEDPSVKVVIANIYPTAINGEQQPACPTSRRKRLHRNLGYRPCVSLWRSRSPHHRRVMLRHPGQERSAHAIVDDGKGGFFFKGCDTVAGVWALVRQELSKETGSREEEWGWIEETVIYVRD
jgi:hypothetical protein